MGTGLLRSIVPGLLASLTLLAPARAETLVADPQDIGKTFVDFQFPGLTFSVVPARHQYPDGPTPRDPPPKRARSDPEPLFRTMIGAPLRGTTCGGDRLVLRPCGHAASAHTRQGPRSARADARGGRAASMAKHAVKIKLVVATRESESGFFSRTAIGRSVSLNRPAHLALRVFTNNTRGLLTHFNQAIRESAGDPATLVFAHDDLHLLDYFWYDRVMDGLARFDIVGLAGTTRRMPRQPAWCLQDLDMTPAAPADMSGVVGHGTAFPPGNMSRYGAPRQRVKLLDGLLLAVRSETLLEHDLRFDERFDFDFYDMDFCRQAEVKGLSCGTWDISVIHESAGSFGSPAWRAAYARYLDKWQDG